MSNIEITQTLSNTFGNCVRMSDGTLELLVTVDFGPRIISFSRVGGKNVFYQDASKAAFEDVPGSDSFILYGGHRLWTSPEAIPRTYYPDNAPVNHTIDPDGSNPNEVRFYAPIERINGVRKTLAVSFTGDGKIKLDHTIENRGAWDIEFAIWALTNMAQGGLAVFPMPKRETGKLHNRVIALWDYTDMRDPRVHWGTSYITLKQDPSATSAFKLGYNNEDGWAAYFGRDSLFINRFEPVIGGCYPDGGVCFESYTNGDFLEIETLGELGFLAPGQSKTHTETWELHEEASIPYGEDEIKAVMAKYL